MFLFHILLIVSFLECSLSYFYEGHPVNVGNFWHVTDIHLDQNYSRNGNPNNLCHKESVCYQDNGLYGNFQCDSPEYLVDVTIKAMKKINYNPDFIIWTGDNLPHTLSNDPDWDVIYETLHNITVLFNENFPGIPLFPCIGNHDTFPPNMLLPNKTADSIYLKILTKGGWNKYLNDESVSTFIKGGYYNQVLRPGLRLISLNTILWYAPNYFTEKMIDPADQFKWLEEVLNKSSKMLEKVYIIGHVPPGFYNRVKPGTKSSSTYHSQHLDKYLQILKNYSSVITGQMFGHFHIDMFQIFSFESNLFVSSSLLASSVTPWHFKSKDSLSLPVNPSVRLMHYNRNSGLLKDYDQFFLNLTKANKMDKIADDLFELLYTFTKSYAVPDVSTDSLVQVYEMIKKNETLFDKFFTFSTAGKEYVMCDTSCKVAQLCSISCTSQDEYNNCMKSKTIRNLDFPCHDNDANQGFSKVFAYGIAIMILCMSIILCVFLCQRYRRSHSEIYTKLLREL